jgi:hypothetical protein
VLKRQCCLIFGTANSGHSLDSYIGKQQIVLLLPVNRSIACTKGSIFRITLSNCTLATLLRIGTSANRAQDCTFASAQLIGERHTDHLHVRRSPSATSRTIVLLSAVQSQLSLFRRHSLSLLRIYFDVVLTRYRPITLSFHRASVLGTCHRHEARNQAGCQLSLVHRLSKDHLEQDFGSTASSMASLSMLPPGKSRKKKAPTLRESDWKPHQGRITELYTSGMPLKEVKDVIELETSFSAEYVLPSLFYFAAEKGFDR